MGWKLESIEVGWKKYEEEEGVVDGGLSVNNEEFGSESIWSTKVEGSGVEGRNEKSWFLLICVAVMSSK